MRGAVGRRAHVGTVTGERLLGLPVRLNGIRLGHPVDVLLDLARGLVLGLEVLCGDDRVRFLPLAAARVEEAELAVGSPLTLVDESGASFYHDRAQGLRLLRGGSVERDDAELGTLRDVVLDRDGRILELVLLAPDGLARVQSDGTLRVGGFRLRC